MARKRSSEDDWFRCPCCGAELPMDATFCRECGASAESGWGEESPDEEDEFDYDDFVRREFPQHAARRRRSPKQLWMLGLVLLVVAALLVGMLGPCR